MHFLISWKKNWFLLSSFWKITLKFGLGVAVELRKYREVSKAGLAVARVVSLGGENARVCCQSKTRWLPRTPLGPLILADCLELMAKHPVYISVQLKTWINIDMCSVAFMYGPGKQKCRDFSTLHSALLNWNRITHFLSRLFLAARRQVYKFRKVQLSCLQSLHIVNA